WEAAGLHGRRGTMVEDVPGRVIEREQHAGQRQPAETAGLDEAERSERVLCEVVVERGELLHEVRRRLVVRRFVAPLMQAQQDEEDGRSEEQERREHEQQQRYTDEVRKLAQPEPEVETRGRLQRPFE